MKNFIGWLLDLCPFVGGIKMTIEGVRGKTFLTGQKLQGFGRVLHTTVGGSSVFMDFTGVGGVIERGAGKAASQALAKGVEKGVVTTTEKVAEKETIKAAGKNIPSRQLFNSERFKKAALEQSQKYRASYNKEDEREKGVTGQAREMMPEFSLRQARGNIGKNNEPPPLPSQPPPLPQQPPPLPQRREPPPLPKRNEPPPLPNQK